VPPLKMVVVKKKSISEIEQRKLVEFPELTFRKNSLKALPGLFELFIKDHLGFRSSLIQCHNYIKAIWLKKSAAPNIILGKKNWLFYTGDMNNDIIDDFRGKAPFSEPQLKAWNDLLDKRNKWLANQGIRYLFFVSPNKHSIYPEFLPAHLNKVHPETRFDQLANYIKEKSTSDVFLDLRPPLIKGKKKSLVYPPTDEHWSGEGAFIVYQSIIDRLSQWFPEINALPPSSFTKKVETTPGLHLAHLLYLTDFFTDKKITYTPKANCSEETTLAVNIEKYFTKGCGKNSLRAVVFRDSFFVPIVDLLSEHFEQVVYIWDWYDRETMKKLIKRVNPDVVIEEFVERCLYTQFLPIASLNKEAKSLLEQGKILAAIPKLKKALELNPEHPEMNNTLGYAFLQINKLNKASILFKKALKLDPNYELARKNLRLCMERLNKIDRELNSIKNMLNKDPENYLLCLEAGKLLQSKGDITSAAIFYEKALSINSKSIPALNNLGFLFADVGNYAKAASFFKQAITIKPDNADTYYNLACMYARLDKPLKSINFLKTAIEKGYNNLSLIKSDKDLENIRKTDYYMELMDSFQDAEESI
jgi:tetratricopeptide (TPR) repeat protein